MDYNKVIRSISTDQHEILYNIMMMHNGGGAYDCDMTYSIGNFYGKFMVDSPDGEKSEIVIPAPEHKFDVCPQVDGVVQIDPDGLLPLEDKSIGSMVIDLPFVVSCGPSLDKPSRDEKGNKSMTNIISKRFAWYYPVANLLKSYKHWIFEAYRVLKDDGLMVFKTQATITGGKMLNTPYFSRMMAEAAGFDSLDEFVLIAKNRLISGKVKTQQHARSFHSYFLCFRKSQSKKVMYFDFMDNDELIETMSMAVDNNLSKKRRGCLKITDSMEA